MTRFAAAQPTGALNVLALVKGEKPNEERYVFVFDWDRLEKVLETIFRFASNPELSFTWYDAARLSKKLRESTS